MFTIIVLRDLQIHNLVVMREHVKFKGIKWLNGVTYFYIFMRMAFLYIHENIGWRTHLCGRVLNCSYFQNGRQNCLLKVNMSDMDLLIEVVMVKMITFVQCNAQHVSLHKKMSRKWQFCKKLY